MPLYQNRLSFCLLSVPARMRRAGERPDGWAKKTNLSCYYPRTGIRRGLSHLN